MRWASRAKVIEKEILRHRPAVCCLQELDATHYRQRLRPVRHSVRRPSFLISHFGVPAIRRRVFFLSFLLRLTTPARTCRRTPSLTRLVVVSVLSLFSLCSISTLWVMTVCTSRRRMAGKTAWELFGFAIASSSSNDMKSSLISSVEGTWTSVVVGALVLSVCSPDEQSGPWEKNSARVV